MVVFDKKYSETSNFVKHYYSLKYIFVLLYILKCQLLYMWKLSFHPPLLQSSVSHDPSEIPLYADLVLK